MKSKIMSKSGGTPLSREKGGNPADLNVCKGLRRQIRRQEGGRKGQRSRQESLNRKPQREQRLGLTEL